MAVHLDRWSTATAVFQDRARVKPETAADAMSLQKREVAKDDRAQEGSITLDRKTRKRSRVIACMGKFAAAIRSRIRRTPLPAQKRAGAFFSQFVYRSVQPGFQFIGIYDIIEHYKIKIHMRSLI